jgi:DNA-binding transcriptional MerR regulator
MRIGEVSRLLGLSAATLRYYEREGLVPPTRRHGGKRRYAAIDVARLRLLKTARALGVTIADLRLMVTCDVDRQAFLAQQLAKTEARLSALSQQGALLRLALDCACVEPAECRLTSSLTG